MQWHEIKLEIFQKFVKVDVFQKNFPEFIKADVVY